MPAIPCPSTSPPPKRNNGDAQPTLDVTQIDTRKTTLRMTAPLSVLLSPASAQFVSSSSNIQSSDGDSDSYSRNNNPRNSHNSTVNINNRHNIGRNCRLRSNTSKTNHPSEGIACLDGNNSNTINTGGGAIYRRNRLRPSMSPYASINRHNTNSQHWLSSSSITSTVTPSQLLPSSTTSLAQLQDSNTTSKNKARWEDATSMYSAHPLEDVPISSDIHSNIELPIHKDVHEEIDINESTRYYQADDGNDDYNKADECNNINNENVMRTSPTMKRLLKTLCEMEDNDNDNGDDYNNVNTNRYDNAKISRMDNIPTIIHNCSNAIQADNEKMCEKTQYSHTYATENVGKDITHHVPSLVKYISTELADIRDLSESCMNTINRYSNATCTSSNSINNSISHRSRADGNLPNGGSILITKLKSDLRTRPLTRRLAEERQRKEEVKKNARRDYLYPAIKLRGRIKNDLGYGNGYGNDGEDDVGIHSSVKDGIKENNSNHGRVVDGNDNNAGTSCHANSDDENEVTVLEKMCDLSLYARTPRRSSLRIRSMPVPHYN